MESPVLTHGMSNVVFLQKGNQTPVKFLIYEPERVGRVHGVTCSIWDHIRRRVTAAAIIGLPARCMAARPVAFCFRDGSGLTEGGSITHEDLVPALWGASSTRLRG